MTEPTRLLHEGSADERRFLSAAAAEEPPRDGAKRVALALGLGVATLSAAAPAQAASKGALAKLVSTKLASKTVLLLAAGAAIALTVSRRLLPPEAAPSQRSELRSPADPRPSTSAKAVLLPKSAPELLPEAAPAHASIADEVARLDAARALLAARKSEAALSALAVYERHYPRGTLLPEARRLRIEVWLARGDAQKARALSRDFLRDYPDSPHAAVLRRVAESRDEAPPTP